MIPYLVFIGDTNVTNLTHNLLRWSIQPYINILGPLALPLIFLLPVLIIWSNIPTHKPIIVAGYMLAVGFIMFQLFDANVALLFQFITVLLTAPIFYYGLFKRGPNE
jgi:membrane-bound ClpP family serine protease